MLAEQPDVLWQALRWYGLVPVLLAWPRIRDRPLSYALLVADALNEHPQFVECWREHMTYAHRWWGGSGRQFTSRLWSEDTRSSFSTNCGLARGFVLGMGAAYALDDMLNSNYQHGDPGRMFGANGSWTLGWAYQRKRRSS